MAILFDLQITSYWQFAIQNQELTLIDLYTSPTPNGWKVGITFEETGIPYNMINLDLSDLINGQYFIRYLKNGESTTTRILIQK